MEKAKVLLVVMPFHNIWSPNIGVSILQASLKNKGYTCDIYYANIEFSRLTGLDFAEVTHESFLLSNDLLFAHLLENRFDDLKELTDDDGNSRRAILFKQIIKYSEDFINSAAHKIVDGNYDLVGFTLIFQSVPSLALAKRIKELSPTTKIIVGGSNCAGEMGRTIHSSFPWIDYLCTGDGEEVIVDLVSYLSMKKKTIDQIGGLLYRKNGKSIQSKSPSQVISNLDKLPYPDYDDWLKQLDINNFDTNSNRRILPFETSRGCWYADIQQCIFCGLNGGSLTARSKSSKRAIEELNYLYKKYNVSNFLSTDLVFPNQYFDTFLPELSQSDLDVQLIYEVKANLTRKQLEKFVRANIKTLQPGLETMNSAILEKMRKGTKAYHNIRLLKWAFEMGISVIWNIIYGIPGEKTEDYEEMVQLIPSISHLQPPLFGIFPIVLQRFSPLYNEIIESGKWEVKPLREYSKIYNLHEDELKKLAYYFVMPQKNVFKYVDPLKEKLSEWFTNIGKSIFFSLAFGNKLYFYDSRPVTSKKNNVLEGIEAQIYKICDKGTSLKAIIENINYDEQKIRSILSNLIKEALVIYIDEKYLSLAVSMDQYIHEELDAETNLTICASIYRTIMKKKCSSLQKVGERNLKPLDN